jgi:hypothetical protein
VNGSLSLDDAILFVGLGRMGGPLASRLAQAMSIERLSICSQRAG